MSVSRPQLHLLIYWLQHAHLIQSHLLITWSRPGNIDCCLSPHIHCLLIPKVHIKSVYPSCHISSHRDHHCKTEKPIASMIFTAPVMGGKTAPPDIAAMRKDPHNLMWGPKPRRGTVKIATKYADSKQRARIRAWRWKQSSSWVLLLERIRNRARCYGMKYWGLKAGIGIKSAATKRLEA